MKYKEIEIRIEDTLLIIDTCMWKWRMDDSTHVNLNI